MTFIGLAQPVEYTPLLQNTQVVTGPSRPRIDSVRSSSADSSEAE
jgi:hypothetical protein